MLRLWHHTLGGICYSWFYHTWLITLLWPSLSLCRLFWTPWTIFVPLMFPISSLKIHVIFHMRLLNPFLCIYVDMTLKPTYIGMCAKGQIVLEFSLMWIRVTCLLAFHMPWDRSSLTFNYPIEALYKEPFGYIEKRGIKEQENYSPLWP